MTLADDIDALCDYFEFGARRRFPVIRAGDREPIGWLVRRAVAERDGAACRRCGTTSSPLQLDHIRPWSAGGSDQSANLRLLCAACNMARSNYFEGDIPPRLPCTYWCVRCAGVSADSAPQLAYCASCHTEEYAHQVI